MHVADHRDGPRIAGFRFATVESDQSGREIDLPPLKIQKLTALETEAPAFWIELQRLEEGSYSIPAGEAGARRLEIASGEPCRAAQRHRSERGPAAPTLSSSGFVKAFGVDLILLLQSRRVSFNLGTRNAARSEGADALSR
jgi:hypothetical protein